MIVELCSEAHGFVRDKPGASLRTRFDKLVKQYRDAERVSHRASGTTEKYKEREMLLQDIIQRMDGWKSQRENEKQAEHAKNDGIEASGALMLCLVMGELEEELLHECASADEDDHESSIGTTETATLTPAQNASCVRR